MEQQHSIEHPVRYHERPIYPTDLNSQKEALQNDSFLREAEQKRREIMEDELTPRYHYVSSHGNLNDPNGLYFWRGKWHLFYQEITQGTIYWGHCYSEDGIRWTELPYGIYPGEENQSWSGSIWIDKDEQGNDLRAIAVYYGHGGQTGLYCAVSDDDLLLNFTKVSESPVISCDADFSYIRETVPFVEYPLNYDPCIWKCGNTYCVLSAGIEKHEGGSFTRQEQLYQSEDLLHWRYVHPFIVDDRFNRLGNDAACPYFWKLSDQKHLLLCFSHKYGAQYLLGKYDREKQTFSVTGSDIFSQVGLFAGYRAPSAFPEQNGEGVRSIYMFFSPHAARCMSIPIVLTEGPMETLIARPAPETALLRTAPKNRKSVPLPKGEEVCFDVGNSLSAEIDLTVKCSETATVTVKFARSEDGNHFGQITLYPHRSFHGKEGMKWYSESAMMLQVDHTHENSSCPIPNIVSYIASDDGVYRIHIFLDRSIIEVFSHCGLPSALRFTPHSLNDIGFSVTASEDNCEIISIDSYELKA